MPLTTPVVFIIFNRPHLTEAVFAAIAAARPTKLFVVADGPRFPKEADECRAARSVIDRINWDCEIHKTIAEDNLGCRQRVASGLDWAFSQVDEAIILEDDCVPHPSFFRYCETLLDRYRHDERVMEIGGGNYQFGHRRTEHSYYFSKYSHTWGWATWKRAWRFFDESILTWPTLIQTGVWNLLWDDAREQKYWRSIYDRIFEGRLRTSWDYQWQLARWCQSGLTIVPSVNLVSNIGFGQGATNTRWRWDTLSQLPTYDIGEIHHPPFIVRHRAADEYLFRTIYKVNHLRRAVRMAQNYWRLSGSAH